MKNIERFKPDDSGKYSKLLYNFLRRNVAMGKIQVFQRAKYGTKNEYADDWGQGQLIIGYRLNQTVYGRTLGSIIRGERGFNGQTIAYPIKMFGLRSITREFWKRYARDGRCVWDQDHRFHMLSGDQRFQTSKGGLTRICNWCGKKFKGTRRVLVERTAYIEWKHIA